MMTQTNQPVRRERIFSPQSTTPTWITKSLGALGALALGAGFYTQVAPFLGGTRAAFPHGAYVLAGGAFALGLAILFGTSGDAEIRVGSGGVGVDKGGLRRIPWWSIDRITWDETTKTVEVGGRDSSGVELVIRAPIKNQSQAAAWIVKEGLARVPVVVDVMPKAVPEARADAAAEVAIDTIQVVGKRCSATQKVIAYEPDARICPRCERIYHKSDVPSMCRCGAALEREPRGAQPA